MFKPFGYTHKRTVLQFCTFWIWVITAFGYHYYKYQQSEKIKAERAAEDTGKNVSVEEGAPEQLVEDNSEA